MYWAHHSDGFIHRRELQLDRVFGRNRGMNFDDFGQAGKTRLLDFKLIDAIGQALYVKAP